MNSIDDFTFDHLLGWIRFSVTEDRDHALKVANQMLALVRDDVEYWLNQGWPRVFAASGAQYPE